MITIKGELHSSKNSRRVVRSGGKTRVLKSAVSKADESSFEWQLLAQISEWREMLKKSSVYPVRICFFIRRKTKARFDYVNIVQGLCDAMVKAGYLPDDNADHLLPSFLPYVVDKNNPGCDFWIER